MLHNTVFPLTSRGSECSDQARDNANVVSWLKHTTYWSRLIGGSWAGDTPWSWGGRWGQRESRGSIMHWWFVVEGGRNVGRGHVPRLKWRVSQIFLEASTWYLWRMTLVCVNWRPSAKRRIFCPLTTPVVGVFLTCFLDCLAWGGGVGIYCSKGCGKGHLKEIMCINYVLTLPFPKILQP